MILKFLRAIFRLLVGLIVTAYACLLLLVSLPVVQHWVARQAEDVVGQLLGTRVKIGSIDISFLGYAQIDSLLVEDRMGYPMLFASRVSAKVSITSLLDRTVDLEHAQLYGLRAALRQEEADSAWNFQFVIDALSSDSKGSNPWLIKLNSIMMRRGVVTVDRLYMPYKVEGFDPAHLVLRHFALDGEIEKIKGDTIILSTSRLSVAEQSGLRITDFDARLEKLGTHVNIPQCVLRMPHSMASIAGRWDDGKWSVHEGRFIIDTEDFAPLSTQLTGKGAVELRLQAQGDTTCCNIIGLQLLHNAVYLATDANLIFSPFRVETDNMTARVNLPLLTSTAGQGWILPQFCSSSDYTLAFNGCGLYSQSQSHLQGTFTSPHGDIDLRGVMTDTDHFDLSMSTTMFDLSPMAQRLGLIACTAQAKGSLKRRSVNAEATVPLLHFGGYDYHDISLTASLVDSLVNASLDIRDPNACGSLTASADIVARHLLLDTYLKHLCPDALDGKVIEDTTSYSAHLVADVTVPQDVMRTTGRIELWQPCMRGSLLADSVVITSHADSLRRIDIASSFMQASIVARDFERLVRTRHDRELCASMRLWDDTPLDSLFGIHLALLDTLRLDAKGSADAIMAQMSFDSGMKYDELHVGATAGYRSDSIWLDLSLHSPDGDKSNGHIKAHAMLTDSTGLSDVRAHVENLNVGYIMNLVDFHSVEFDGWASGDVEMQERDGHPFILSLLDIRQLTMNDAHMGGLDVILTFDTGEGRLGIDGLIVDAPNGHFTHAHGYVIPGHRPTSGMDLLIDARRINAAFVNDFTQGIFEDIEGRVTGNARVYGKFSKIDLYGNLCVDTMSCRVPMLGTGFQARGDSVLLRPGVFRFPQFHINDGRGGTAVVDGELRHKHFSDINYKFDISADNLLGYSFDTFTDMPFYATAIATGNVKIEGEPGKLDVNIRCTPQSGTTLVYDSYTPTATTNADFITYGHLNSHSNVHEEEAAANVVPAIVSSNDINLHFDLNVTRDATLRVITDAVSGDAIELNGDGHITADYYNKGSFKMYGQYVVSHGQYNLSIQSIISKKFDFRPGGTLTFGGAPLQGDLNLQAVYPVHGVSLNDLSSRATFNSSNVHVDCIMNLGGKCEAPRVTFDFDLRGVNDDEKQMVRSLISTDEERNMQVLYLLGIGRFYSYDYQGSSGQGNVAMKSLLSSTLSSTINNVIGNALGTSNWSFGTSIATGDLGWSDMDIEGLISGRLFNNRLLVNGQFGYRDRTTTGSNFIGDFDLQWFLTNNGNVSLKAYSETNDRYFTKSSLTTQGIGLLLKKDFNNVMELMRPNKKMKIKQTR